VTTDLRQQQFRRRVADNHSVVIPRVARVFLAVELVLGAGYFVLPPSLPRALAYCGLGLGTAVALAAGARRWRPSRPLAWYLMAVGQLSFVVGDAILYTYEWVLHLEAPFPSVADAFYLAFYPLLAAGLLLLVRGRAPGRDWASLIDATIITTGVGFDPLAARELVTDGHFGLAGMRERVEMAGGSHRLRSEPGDGTSIRVRLPRRQVPK